MADEVSSNNSGASNGASIEMTNGTSPHGGTSSGGVDLNWVWKEVRKRVFIKLPFSLGVADAMEAAIPLALDDDVFVCGLAPRDFPLSGHLHADNVRNTIENILRQASRKHIRFEVIEGTNLSDWTAIKDRQKRAHTAVIAIAERKLEEHHFEDVLNQIISELRARITAVRDRTLPQVRAHLMLEIVPQLSDTEEMLFAEHETHDRRRAMARAIDRIAGFLEVPPLTLAIEVERHRLQNARPAEKTAISSNPNMEAAQTDITPQSEANPTPAA